MIQEQPRSVERVLWIALRTLQERVEVARRLLQRSENQKNTAATQTWKS